MAEPDLNIRQRRFIEEWIKEPNATKAAIAAGYTAKTARQQGARLLSNAVISAEIERIKAAATQRAELSAEWVLDSLKTVAERCMQAVPVMEKVDGEWKETGEFRFDSSGANKSLELLGKHLKIFTDKSEISGPGGEPVSVKVMFGDD